MALIKCGECGRDISSLAPACPGCGAPTKAAAQAEPTTIQATGKQYKGLQLTGVLLILAGVVVGIGGAPVFGPLLGGLGVVCYIFGRVGGWWANG
ncbi:MAG TPA: hypothetical protein VF216_09840 [Mizugakiibacter sp.]